MVTEKMLICLHKLTSVQNELYIIRTEKGRKETQLKYTSKGDLLKFKSSMGLFSKLMVQCVAAQQVYTSWLDY